MPGQLYVSFDGYCYTCDKPLQSWCVSDREEHKGHVVTDNMIFHTEEAEAKQVKDDGLSLEDELSFLRKFTNDLEAENEKLSSLLAGAVFLAIIFALVAISLSIYIVGM